MCLVPWPLLGRGLLGLDLLDLGEQAIRLLHRQLAILKHLEDLHRLVAHLMLLCSSLYGACASLGSGVRVFPYT